MTLTTDTRPQDTARSAQPGYGSEVDEDNTPSMLEARQAITDLAALADQAEQVRARRDEAIVDIHRLDGLRPPDIARALGMSLSNVRLIIKSTRPRGSQ